MTMEEIVSRNIEEAKAKYPQKAKIYDKALLVYKTMLDEGHSGFSWAMTRNTMYAISTKIKDLKDKQEIIKAVNDYVDGLKSLDGNLDSFASYGNMVVVSAGASFLKLVDLCDTAEEIQEVHDVFNRLAKDKPLIPIEDNPEIWHFNDFGGLKEDDDVPRKSYQCTKMSSLFKDVYADGTVSYHDQNRAYCSEMITNDDGETHESTYVSWKADIVDLLWPITMPYMPEDKAYKVNIETVKYDKERNLDMILIKSVDTPSGEHRVLNLCFKEIDITKPGDKYLNTANARARYDEFIEAKRKQTNG